MKKTLIALAVLAASGAAMAQSTVTLYGVADAAVVVGTNASYGANGAHAEASGWFNNGNSRFGLKGSEDIGGGTKVNFNFEGMVNVADGSTNTNMFQRAAFLSVTGGFGELAAGRRLSPEFFAVANYELTGTANYSSLVNMFGTGGALRNNAFVSYTTPDMGGLKAMLGTILSPNNGGHSKTDMNVTYNNGPLAVGFGYDKTSGSDANKDIGFSYDLGQFIVAASYQDPKGDAKGYTVGGTAKLGANTLTLDIARQTGSNATLRASTDYVLEAKEPLSKRTFLYQVYYRHGATGSTVATGSWNGLGLGLRHNF